MTGSAGKFKCGREGRVFFFVNKKEAKKTLLTVGRGTDVAPTWESKFFWFFFVHKKELLSCFWHCFILGL
jgi:hypothetical protein